MNDIEKIVKEFVKTLEEIENEETRTIMLVIFLSSCRMNEEQIEKWFEKLRLEYERSIKNGTK